MKKMFLFIMFIVFCAFLSGCAANRTVTGNTFQSDYPKLNIKINEEFKYLDKIHDSSTNKSIDGNRVLQNDNEYYLFVSEDRGHKVKKLLYVNFYKTETHFIDMMAEDKSNLDFGVLNFNGHNFKYYKRIVRPNASRVSTKYYMDAGYIVPSCALESRIYIIPYKDLWVSIYYIEDATPSGMSCKDKYSMNTLSNEQKEYLAGLHNRALSAIGIGDTTKQQSMSTVVQEQPRPANVVAEKPVPQKDNILQQNKQESPKIPVGTSKIKIAITEFQNLNEESKRENFGSMFAEMLTTSFVGSEAFRITEREQLKKVAQELQFNQSGIIDVTQAKQLGKMVGADAIITGSVTKIGDDLRLDARIIDVESGIILTAEKITGKISMSSISEMADKIMKNLVNKFYSDTNLSQNSIRSHSADSDSSGLRQILKLSIEQKEIYPNLQSPVLDLVSKMKTLEEGCADGWIKRPICDKNAGKLSNMNGKINSYCKDIQDIKLLAAEKQRIVNEAQAFISDVSRDIRADIILSVPVSDNIIFSNQPKRSELPEKSIAGKCQWDGTKWIRYIMLYNGAQKKDVTQKMIDYVMSLQPDHISKSKKTDPWEMFEYKLFGADSAFYQNTYYPYR